MKSVLLLALATLIATATTALGDNATVDQLTCAQAVAQVESSKRYYVRTSDGAIPITHIIPVSKDPICNRKEHVTSHLHRTVDNGSCLVGYTCTPH